MKKIFLFLSMALALHLSALPSEILQKKIYQPKASSAHDSSKADEDVEFGWDSSKWDKSRMVTTDNVVLFWAPGFGDNIATAPDLLEITENGDSIRHNMKVDLPNLLSSLERFYVYFRDNLKFIKPDSKAEEYKMMVMLDYSLEGTAYGGDYDSKIGALWVTPNRLQDPRLNCIAHELGHSFQCQISCDGEGEAWGGNGFFEMTSQWMLWQVNPDWQKDERYHLDAFSNLTHKAFLHLDNIYHSPYVIELWGETHGLPFIADLFRQGKRGEDPAMTYMRLTGMSQKEFNDEMFRNYARLVNWDIPRVKDNTRDYTDIWHTDFDEAGGGWKRVAANNCPENYGFNVIPLEVPSPGKKISIQFKGEPEAAGYLSMNPENAGWRYGLVAVDNSGEALYGEMKSDKKGVITYQTPAEGGIKKLWLVVMGAPTKHWQNIDGPDNPGDAQWPYSIKIK